MKKIVLGFLLALAAAGGVDASKALMGGCPSSNGNSCVGSNC
jgi:hypothetical protein